MFYPQYPAVHTQIMLTQKEEENEGKLLSIYFVSFV